MAPPTRSAREVSQHLTTRTKQEHSEYVQWSKLLLTTDIPHSELNILVLHLLHIETCTFPESSSVRRMRCYRNHCRNIYRDVAHIRLHSNRRVKRTDCWNCTQHLSYMELIKDGGFAGRVEAEHDTEAKSKGGS